MMEASADAMIAVGRISGTHGIRGQVKLHSYSGNIASLKAAKEARIRFSDGTDTTVSIQRAALHGGKILLTIADYSSIEQAESLVGTELLLRRDQLPATEADEYYWHDLLGLTVETDAGEQLGSIREILETGANDVYLVRDEATRREYLIPAIARVIHSVNLQAGVMTITPLEGLLDL